MSEEKPGPRENPDDLPLLLRMGEAARICAISRAKLYQMVREGSIPAIRFGGKSLRIPREALKRVIEQGTTNRCAAGPSGGQSSKSNATSARSRRNATGHCTPSVA